MDFSTLNNINFENISNDNLPDLNDYLNPMQSPSKSPSHQSVLSPHLHASNEEEMTNQPSDQNHSSVEMASEKDTVQLSLPSLSAMDYSNPLQPTPMQPQIPNIETIPRKRGRGRPKGSKNKKSISIQQIEEQIMQKTQQINAEMEKFNSAKQVYTTASTWLQNNSHQYKQALFQKAVASLSSNAAQWTQEQLQMNAQKLVMAEYQKVYDTLNQKIQTAQSQMSSASAQCQTLQTQIDELQKNKANAIKNKPSGPIASFHVNIHLMMMMIFCSFFFFFLIFEPYVYKMFD